MRQRGAGTKRAGGRAEAQQCRGGRTIASASARALELALAPGPVAPAVREVVGRPHA